MSEGLETSRASLIKRWREIVDLGILSVGREWNEGYCQCDPSVGMAPCHYCAEHAVILAGEKMLAEIERLRAERIDLVRWMLDRIEDGWHGCVTGDCPHEQASDCIDSLLECFDVDMAARAAGGES